VVPNRLAHQEARNMREISALLSLLANRIGFRTAPGISERVEYRE
jgi:chromosome partitioning protein